MLLGEPCERRDSRDRRENALAHVPGEAFSRAVERFAEQRVSGLNS